MRKITIQAYNTYATEANAIKAAEAAFGSFDNLTYFINRTVDGRFHPVFVGESAVHACVHFRFTVIG